MGQGASSQLLHAAATDNLELVGQLVDQGVDVNSVEEVSLTPASGKFKILNNVSKHCLAFLRDLEGK